jgi:spore coat protein A
LRGQPKPPAPEEDGWKDTVQVPSGTVTRIVATFDKVGRWVWHCHILSHEDHEMMRRFEVV